MLYSVRTVCVEAMTIISTTISYWQTLYETFIKIIAIASTQTILTEYYILQDV